MKNAEKVSTVETTPPVNRVRGQRDKQTISCKEWRTIKIKTKAQPSAV